MKRTGFSRARPRKPLARGKSPLKANGRIERENGLNSRRSAKRGTLRPVLKAIKIRKRAKRDKVASRKSLIKKIDNLVFQIICLMYAACVECNSEDRPTTGHVLSRRSMSTRWDFRNVFRQCWPCNYKAAMTAAASYHAWFVRTHGAEAFEQLYRDWTTGRKYTRLELQNLVPEYQAKLDSLKDQSCT